MKKILQSALIVFVLTISSSSVFSANEFFRSVTSGNWNSNSTWEMSTNGGSIWFAATTTPTDAAGTITVRSPNTVTITANVTADQLTINNGATLSINSSDTLTIVDGPGIDLTLQNNATLSGAGVVQTQGAGTFLEVINGSNFNAALRVKSGNTTSYDSNSPYTAVHNGAILIDAGATFSGANGGYTIQANANVTNNGTIAGSSAFKVRCASFSNTGSITVAALNFDLTTSISGTGSYTGTAITITSTGNVSLANNVTFSPASSFTINGGGTLNPNTRVFTLNSGACYVNNGGTVSNSGTFQTQSSVSLIAKNGSNFLCPLKVNSGITNAYDDNSPFTATLRGSITVDAGSTLKTPGGGYTIRSYGSVTNNGTISGNEFRLKGASIVNNATVNPTYFYFDTTCVFSGSGTISGNYIYITSIGYVTMGGPVTFSPINELRINAGGTLVPSSETFTLTSGTFILETGATVFGVGPSAGLLRTQNTVSFDFRGGSTFNSALKVNTGTLTAFNSVSPYLAVMSGGITVDAGATLALPSGGYTTQANGSVINNGTISGVATFRMKGPSFANNNLVNPNTLQFDSVTTISGSGTYTGSNISIGGNGNVSLANNVTFSPTNDFTVNSNGTLNPNTRTLTFNSGTFNLLSSATVQNSGIFQTQSNVTMNIKNGSNFNAPLKVNTGTTISEDNSSPYTANYKNTITVDAGATLRTPGGGYTNRVYGTVTNNGTIAGNTFIVRGSSLINNGIINPNELDFDTTTALSGSGSYTGPEIFINSSGNVSLLNDVTFSPTSSFSINTGGIFNPNTRTFTFNSGSFYCYSGSTVSASGLVQTRNNINLIARTGSNFNAPLKVNTGNSIVYANASPYISSLNGDVTIDNGATLSGNSGGYTLRCYGNFTNNGTLSGSSTFEFYGTNFANNGTINISSFQFETGSHNAQGMGSWNTTTNLVNTANVTLNGNFQTRNVSIAGGTTMNLAAFKLLVTNSNPISNSGTFTTTSGIIEYNGSVNQTISTSNISYYRLRINNPAGTTLSAALSVNDTLSVITGFLNMNGNIITISPTGYLTETPGNTVRGTSGYITTTRTLNAPSSLNVAGFGAVLTTAVNLGSTEIRRGHAAQNGLNGNTSILRYFDITPTTNTGLNATLVYKYDDTELNGKSEPSLTLFSSTNSGTSWTLRGGTLNTSTNQISITGLGNFSRWSAGSGSVLPVAASIKLLMEGFYNQGTNRLNMRDTARVYLRNNSSPYAIIDSAKSVIDSVTFAGSFLFNNAPSGTYYLHLKHRNSIETWSKSGGESYTFGNVLNYDFTSSAAQAFGSNMVQKGTKFCIYGGDVNQEGSVDLSDIIACFNDATLFASGYIVTDLNGDNFADLTDITLAYNNSILFVAKVVP